MIDRLVLGGTVDYAGLFPPASLSLESAVREYDACRRGSDAWALGRFVMACGRLDDLAETLPRVLPDGPGPVGTWRVAAVGAGDPDAAAVQIQAFQSAAVSRAAVDTLEWKPDPRGDLRREVGRLPAGLHRFIELPLTPDPEPELAFLAEVGVAAKVRTGGVTPDLIPEPDLLLRFLMAATAVRLPFKATAGLHHPVRGVYPLTYEPDSPRAAMHGYLNLTTAVLLLRRASSAADAREALVETEPGAFRLEAEALHWRDHAFGVEELRDLRVDGFGSFGSCSFREPVDALALLVHA